MKVIRKNVVFVLTAVFVVSLAACAGNNGSKNAPAATTPAAGNTAGTPEAAGTDSGLQKAVKRVLEDKEAVNISFWTSTGQRNYPYLEAMTAAFEAEYPNIKVELSYQGAVADLMDKLTQNIVSRSTPTLSNLSPTYFPEYVNSGAIVDLMPFYMDAEIGFTESEKAAFYPFYLEEAMSFGAAGTMYGFPTNKKTADVLFYNKTYFDEQGWEAPATWEDVAGYSKIIKEKTGAPGFSYDVAYAEAAFKLLSMQYGSPYMAADGSPEIDNEASRKALRFYKENFDAGYFTMPSEMPSAGGNYSNSGFVVGECYMFVGAAAGAPYSIPNEESGHTMFEVGIRAVPQLEGGRKLAFSKGEDYCIFANASLEEQVAAWLLVKFMSRDDQNVEWLIHTGNLPITNTISKVPEYKAFLDHENDGSEDYYKAAAVNAALGMADFMSYEQVSDNSSALATNCGAMWKAVIIGGADLDQSLAEAAR